MGDAGPDPERNVEAGAESGVAESLRAAVERTMRTTAGSAAITRDRATELVDEVVRRGRDARDELTRRGQEAGGMLARRGQEATGEVGRRLEVLERRLAELERNFGGPSSEPRPEVKEDRQSPSNTQSRPEG